MREKKRERKREEDEVRQLCFCAAIFMRLAAVPLPWSGLGYFWAGLARVLFLSPEREAEREGGREGVEREREMEREAG